MVAKEDKDIVDYWVSLLYLKNYLATLSSKELCEFASDFNFFQSFLLDSKALFKEEPVFLLLDSSFLEKISDVANCYRFQFSGKQILELSNEIIENINSLLFMSDYVKEAKISHYLLFQEKYRKRKIKTVNNLIKFNANDSIVFTGIEDGEQYLSTFDVLSSLNYFTYICPECFHDNDFYSNALNFLNSCCDVPFYKKISKGYRYSLDTKDAVQKVKKS